MVEEEKAVLQAQLSLEDDAQGCFIQSALCLLKVDHHHHLLMVPGLSVSSRTLCLWGFRSEKKRC